VHVTRTLKELALQVVRARDLLTADLDRSPTLDEIAVHLGVSEEQVAEALGAELGYSQLHISRMLRRALRQMREELSS
jgi:RNA polymerase sigma-B factor